eukprot:757239-Hanusia_phi.AAC.1
MSGFGNDVLGNDAFRLNPSELDADSKNTREEIKSPATENPINPAMKFSLCSEDFQNSLDSIEDQCSKLNTILERPVLDTETEMFSSNFKTRSTVGIMLTGCIIENLVVGGPAYNCQKLNRGDKIIKVDDKLVNSDNVATELVGSDQPGSEVFIEVQKSGGMISTVKLSRVATRVIADRHALFELFTTCKNRARQKDDKLLSDTINKSIDLWTKMVLADQEHDDEIASNVTLLQDLRYYLAPLKSAEELKLSMEALQQEYQQNSRMLKLELQNTKKQQKETKQKLNQLEKEVDRLSSVEDKHKDLMMSFECLKTELVQHRDLLSKVDGDFSTFVEDVSNVLHSNWSLSDRLKQAEETITDLKRQVSSAQDELAAKRRDNEVLNDAISKMNVRLSTFLDLNDVLKHCEYDLIVMITDLDFVRRRLDEEQRTYKDALHSAFEVREKINICEQSDYLAREQMELLRISIMQTINEKSQFFERVNQLDQKLKNKSAIVKQLNMEIDELKKEQKENKEQGGRAGQEPRGDITEA